MTATVEPSAGCSASPRPEYEPGGARPRCWAGATTNRALGDAAGWPAPICQIGDGAAEFSFVASASGAVVPILPFLSSPGAAAIAAVVMICGLGRLFGAT